MKIFLIFIFFLIAFMSGLSTGVYKHTPYELIKGLKFLSEEKIKFFYNRVSKFEKCEIEKTKEVYKNSLAFIGHAYGSPDTASLNDFLSPNAEEFISKNSQKIKGVVFTGDVFSVPSLDKWNKLRTLAGNNLDIIIAPGNHDVLRPDSRDVFNMSEFGKRNYPIQFKVNNATLIVEDSIVSQWAVSRETINMSNMSNFKTVIIARHNSPIEELLPIVNGSTGKSENLANIEKLTNSLDRDKSFFWIIGDGGAFRNLPRSKCLRYKNHTFLVNGLGQISGDSIILYYKDVFFEYLL